MIGFLATALLVLAWSVAACAQSSLPEQRLPGERIGGARHDDRVGPRIDNRLPMRLETRVGRRAVFDPLAAAASKITAAPTNGCQAAIGSAPEPACPAPH